MHAIFTKMIHSGSHAITGQEQNIVLVVVQAGSLSIVSSKLRRIMYPGHTNTVGRTGNIYTDAIKPQYSVDPVRDCSIL